ncbi:MAG: hypothetical protein HGA87_02085 [Desulfobulbaceae bacterium]|nr:hypothetical protein [Desulfobulbaceae bacterium]
MTVRTVKDLDEYVKQFNLHRALIELGNFSVRLFNEKTAVKNFEIKMGIETHSVTVAQWQIAFLAYRLIMSSNDGKRNVMGYKEVLLANSIQAEFDEALLRDGDIYTFFSRLSQQQLWWQENQVRYFSRNHILLNQIAVEDKFKSHINLNEVFLKHYGLSIYDYMTIGWAVFGVTCEKPFFKKPQLLNHTVSAFKEILTEEKLDKFLNLMCVDYSRFRKASEDVNKSVRQGYEQYQFNPLFKLPIIESDKRFSATYSVAPYVVPNIFLLLRKLCDGLYWTLRDIFKEADSKHSRDFLSLFGHIFEDYVGKQLRLFSDKYTVLKLNEDDASREGKKTADWLIDDKECLVLIECKSQLLPNSVRGAFDEENFKSWCVENIVKAVEQLCSSEDALLSGMVKGVSVNGRTIFKVIVTYENIYHAEAKGIKDKILGYVRESDFLKKYPHATENFYTMHIAELEALENVLKKYSWFDIFNQKQAIDKRESMAESNDFIATCKALDKDLKLNNSWVDSSYEDFFKTLIPLRDGQGDGKQ